MKIFYASTAGKRLFLIFALLITGPSAFPQDDPRYDTPVPLRGSEFAPRYGATSISVITTPDGFDNFDLGTTNAEPHMSTNPLNPLWFFTAFNPTGSFQSWHTENGITWTTNNPAWPSNAGDPVSAYDSLGNLYYEVMKSPITGCWVAKSTNNGQTWTAAVTSVAGNDKNWMAADQTMGPYANHVYTTMTNTPGGAGMGNFARTTDGGATWTTTFSPTTQVLPGMMVAVGPDVLGGNNISGGCVYVVTHSGTNSAGVYTMYASTDGGATFTQKSQNQYPNYIGTEISGRSTVQGMRCRPYPMIAADNSFGPNRGRLYLVYASNSPSGNGNKSDIFLRYSTDQGVNWTAPVVVNDDPNSENNFQFHPAIWCDKETGRLYIKFYDTRNTTTSDSMDVYATYTDDGGLTFAANQRLTNRKFRINISGATGPTYRGDYDAITSNKHTSMSVWTDFRNAPSPNYLGMTAYFPDFAMLVAPANIFLGLTDSTNVTVKVPAVKLYTHSARFSATVSPAANFTFSFLEGDSLTSYPDSLTLRVRTANVTPGTYTVTVTGQGPNGTPAHKRTIEIEVVTNTNFVAVQQPNGGEEWLTGTTHDITWVRAGGVDTVRLEYSINNGSSWNLITAAMNAMPEAYPWTLPSTPSTQALVRVTWIDSANVTDQSDAVFSIVGSPVIGMTPDSLDVIIAEDSSITRTLAISNTGLGPLDFTISIEGASSSSSGQGIAGKSAGRSATIPSIPTSGYIGQYADDASPSQAGPIFTETPRVGRWPRSIFGSSPTNLPDLMYYKFDEVGTLKTKNFANPASAVNDSADVLGGLSMGGSGQFGAALIGTGSSSSTAFVSTNWPTSLPGDWAVSMWLSNLPSGTTLYYLWGDVTAGSFRCFYTGAAGANNLLVRGPFNEVLVTGVSPGSSVVDVIYDSSVPEIKAYVNGVLNRTVAQSSLNITGPGPFKIAGYSTLTGMPAGSLMDEFKLYNSLPSSITWLSVDTLSGTVPAGGTMNITTTFDATGLTPGDYYAEIVAQSNDPATPEVRTHAHLLVASVTSVIEGEPLPREFSLTQNFPNPFNPSTHIEYSLPEESSVSLKIFNLLGQEVAALTGGPQNAGHHTVEWNGTSSAGLPVGSGIYFYRFEAHSATGQAFVMMRKMILLK